MMNSFRDIGLTITLLVFEWASYQKSFDILMIGTRGFTRSLLGVQVTDNAEWECDVLFIRFGSWNYERNFQSKTIEGEPLEFIAREIQLHIWRKYGEDQLMKNGRV